MDRYVLRVFHLEVERQCRFGLLAAHNLRKAVDRLDDDRAWYSIQALLIASANVSKLLWPSGRHNKGRPPIPERGEELRATLPVSDPSPLEPRNLRNHFEHFDERLESWATSGEQPIFVDSIVSPLRVKKPGGSGEPLHLRHYDNRDHVVYFGDDSHELIPLVEELERLWGVARKAKRSLPVAAPPKPDQ